ncbi:MAG: hypothetical protein NTZ46_09860, partial [Verrucomicrobia bacterium]|nr:hypothetical protein [Verrucomicrobiota bacterium]
AITEANPDDYQSLEILKDAYWRLEDQCEGLAITRKLADTYLRLGQYSSALLEYEGILLHEPESVEVRVLLEDLETKLNRGNPGAPKASIALDFGLVEMPASDLDSAVSSEPALIATAETRLPQTPAERKAVDLSLDQDVNEPLARFLIQHRLASREIVENALEHVLRLNAAIQADPDTPTIAVGLLEAIIESGVDAEPLLAAILDRTKYAYAPLEYYDIDRQIVKILPQELTLGRRVVPFDIVSRTMMVAIDNPFDLPVKAAVQQSVDYQIQWHLAMPGTIHRILRDSYRLAN